MTTAPVRADAASRRLAVGGTALVAVGMLLVLALHALVPEVAPLRRTISEYALGPWKPVFDAGLLAVSAGSAALLVALVRAGLLRRRPAGTALLAVWTVALVVVVAFEKINWSVGPTPAGYVHRYAGLLAFLCLPAAALAVARGRAGAYAAGTRWLAVGALAWLAPILLGFVLRPLTGVPWWQFVPLGLFERGLALTEAVTLLVLGLWAARESATPR
jgi:hypothetical protein